MSFGVIIDTMQTIERRVFSTAYGRGNIKNEAIANARKQSAEELRIRYRGSSPVTAAVRYMHYTTEERTGIILNLGQNKWLGLIKEASK